MNHLVENKITTYKIKDLKKVEDRGSYIIVLAGKQKYGVVISQIAELTDDDVLTASKSGKWLYNAKGLTKITEDW
jgi:hypothetical protein